jgi:DNA-directed RNA polymerase specialized sigma24 family protein
LDETRECVDRARGGDKAAFEALFGPLLEPACQLAFTFLHDWREAEDVVQEASLKAWRAVGRLRDDTASVRPWFFTIVANEARSRRRGRWWSLVRLASPNVCPSSREPSANGRAPSQPAAQSLLPCADDLWIVDASGKAQFVDRDVHLLV